MINRALRLTREFHRMKQGELAVKLSISSSYLSEIENGKKPASLELLDAYSRVFEVPVSTFMLFRDQVVTPVDARRKQRADRLLKFFEWVVSEDDVEEESTKVSKTEQSSSA